MLFLKVTIANQQKARKANRQNRFFGWVSFKLFFLVLQDFSTFLYGVTCLLTYFYTCVMQRKKTKTWAKMAKIIFLSFQFRFENTRQQWNKNPCKPTPTELCVLSRAFFPISCATYVCLVSCSVSGQNLSCCCWCCASFAVLFKTIYKNWDRIRLFKQNASFPDLVFFCRFYAFLLLFLVRMIKTVSRKNSKRNRRHNCPLRLLGSWLLRSDSLRQAVYLFCNFFFCF